MGDIEVNPYECGQGWQVDLTKDAFVGKDALAKIKKEGVTHKLAGLRMGGKPITWYQSDFYLVLTHTGFKHWPCNASSWAHRTWYKPRGCFANIVFQYCYCASNRREDTFQTACQRQ